MTAFVIIGVHVFILLFAAWMSRCQHDWRPLGDMAVNVKVRPRRQISVPIRLDDGFFDGMCILRKCSRCGRGQAIVHSDKRQPREIDFEHALRLMNEDNRAHQSPTVQA